LAELPNFSLLPFETSSGQQITSPEQITERGQEFYTQYYYNHRVLAHGNLTGMVQFQTSTPWSSIKGFRSKYFAWMRENKVFLNYTKFKMETLVPTDFLVGAHPGHLHCDEAEVELRCSLGLSEGELSFQITSHTITVPTQEGSTQR
jgi:hypothetical protein